jgi:hypothetical protein
MTHEAETDVCREAPRARRGWRAALLVCALALGAAACSSGSGGDDVTIGSGQNSDPVTLDFPVFYVKRPVPEPGSNTVQDNARRLLRFEIGADLYMRDRASPSAPEVNLTAEETQGLGDIRDVDVSYDGTKVIFSMRARFIENADEEDQPTWNIWEYDTRSRVLRRVIASDTTAEEGHDIMPHYLPDGRIVFSSTRQRQSRAILLDENKPQFAAMDEDNREPAFVLHVMEADGTNINQISFNQSHDLDPEVLPNGQIVFTRWEHHIDDDQFDLYRINPDGTGLELLYGAASHATGTINPTTGQPSVIQFLNPRPMPDGRILALVRPFQGTDEGGDLVLIDVDTYVNNTQPTAANAGMTGPAQARALPTDVRTIPGPSPGGRYRSAVPLFDGTDRLLVSWSQCRLLEDSRIVPCTSDRLNNTATPPVTAPPLYGIYVYDVRTNTQQPVVAPQEGFIYTEVVAGSGRPLPPVILDRVAGVDYDEQLLTEAVGVLHIRSVYDVDGTDTAPGGIAAVSNPANPAYATRPARFLRIEKAVSMPDDDIKEVPNTAFGPNRTLGMREILGYAPIEPDGSVLVKVPANVAFGISVLGENGQRLGGVIGGRHTNWLQVKPGEKLECNGCHNPNTTPATSHGRSGLFNSINAGATTVGQPFPNANPNLWAGDIGKTMAEVRGQIMCGGACKPSVNIVFDDHWQPVFDPARSFDMCYTPAASDVRSDPADPEAMHKCATQLQTELPTTASCSANWTSACRVTIHYERHIHPLWSLSRPVDADNDGVPDVDNMGNPIDNRCDSCHSRLDAANAAQIPAGQLDLSDGPSQTVPEQLNAYRQLLFTHTRLALEGGQLVEECAQTDPETQVCLAFATVTPPMSSAGANASTRFFNTFRTAGAQVDHRGFLTPAELKLLSEWLDVGAQYYNDPFVVPEN